MVLDGAEKASDSWSPCWTLGFRILRSLSKAYCIGMSFEFRSTHYRFNDSPANEIESAINSAGLDITTLFRGFDTRRLLLNEHVLELFQRVRLVPIGLMGNGLHWDLGVYGSIASRITYDVSGDLATRTVAERVGISIRDIQSLRDYHLNYGLVTRLAYDWIGIYLHYRLNNIGQDVPAGKILFPRLTTGLYLTF